MDDSKTYDIRVLASLANRTARDKGWWDEERSFGDCCALIHSEVSEALEAFRELEDVDKIREMQYEPSPIGPKPVGVASELADVLIRVFDACEHFGIPLDDAVLEKLSYNRSRPWRHGGKRL